ncbi:hypothetical protein IKF02_00785 [Candidatus Saccharibacteria bacterium]|nr:hypothetical protein [Candidatus Saccharibacteria bacterium]
MKIKHSHQPLTYITYSILGITVLTGILLSCNIPIFPGISVNGSTLATTQTKTTTTNASVRVSNFCSMTANIQPGEEHSTTLIGGQYQADIGKTTIQTFCNDPNGYAIYAIGYTGGDAGVAAGTNTVLHSNALGSTYDIVTGIAQSGDTSNWAMKVSSISGTYAPTIESDTEGSFSDYHTVPSSYTKVAKFNTSTDATIGSSLTTTYATYISPTQPAGTYEGQVKYVLLHPASNLGPGVYYMQDVEEWGGTIAIGQEVTAYDDRDNKAYTVRRMCMSGTGDNCTLTNSMLWMTQNLDLCIGCTGTDTLTSENTNITEYQIAEVNFADYTIENGLIVWRPTASTMTGAPAYITTANGTTVSGYTNNYNIPYMAEGGDRYSYQGTRYNSLEDCKTAGHSATECAHYHIGNYYNWSASVAMSDTSAYTTNYTVMPNSICPKGWRLPNGITEDPTDNTVKIQSDFNKLLSTYNIANGTDLAGSTNIGWKPNGFINIGLSPLYLVRSGLISGQTMYGYGANGLYWTSTISSTSTAYALNYYSGELRPANPNSRSDGWSVRCVSDY